MNAYSYGLFVIGMTIFLFLFTRKRQKGKQALVLLYIISNFIYLGWRTLYTLPYSGWFPFTVGIILLISEMIGYLQSLVFYTILWKPKKRRWISLEFMEKLPTVDIFIATYNEPVNVLRKVVASCTYLDYPTELVQIYLCDDGKRTSVKELAEEFNVHYVMRDNNLHAKAGNLNHAMCVTKGEIIVTLDADMVVKSNFLQRTIGYFSNPKVSFVQTPQAFYNADPFQYNLFAEKDIPNEQDFFMRVLQSGRDRFNSIVFVGTNTLFRRTALEEVGGFATGVITEDMATGMLLQAKYESVFVDEVLARGLSVESWEDLIRQRDRWCRGNIQCAKKWNPLTHKGLTLMQRIIYADGILYWFFGLFKIIYILTPLLFLLFGISSLQSSVQDVLLFWLPAYLTSRIAFHVISENKRNVIWTHIYETSMAPYLAISAIFEMFFNKQFQFKVTPKGITNERLTFKWKVVAPHLILFVLTALAYAKSIFYFLHIDETAGIYAINLFWVTFNAIGIIASIFLAFERPRFRQFERFPVQLDARLGKLIECKIDDMSETGLKARAFKSEQIAELVEHGLMELSVENLKLMTKVVWKKERKDMVEIGLNFMNLTTDEYRNIVRLLFDNENYFFEKKEERHGLPTIFWNFVQNNHRTTKLQRSQKKTIANSKGFGSQLKSKSL